MLVLFCWICFEDVFAQGGCTHIVVVNVPVENLAFFLVLFFYHQGWYLRGRRASFTSSTVDELQLGMLDA